MRGRRLVLVVEDDPGLRQLYRNTLLLDGFVVVAAEDGLEALRVIERQSPDAVVLDLGLPRVDGRDVRRELAANVATRDIPVVVVTGDTRALNPADFTCVLRKPVDPDDLSDVVRKCVRQSERHAKGPAKAGPRD